MKNVLSIRYVCHQPMRIQIEEFSTRYMPQVIDLILNIQQNEFHVPISLAEQPDLLSIPSFYQNGKGNFWIALNDEEVVGTIALLSYSDHEGALRKMFVKKEFRGKEFGTAQKLFNAFQVWAKEKGIREIYLGTLPHMYAAQSFYKRNGFIEIEKDKLPERYPVMHVDSVFMSLQIK